MKAQSILAIFFFLNTCAIAQGSKQKSDSIFLISSVESTSKMSFLSNEGCLHADQIAKNDIEKNKVKLLIIGGIAPKIYLNQNIFEEKYNLKYFDYGDVAPDSQCLLLYNKTMFDYMTTKYGTKWLKEVRPDVYGLKEWKKEK
jgi:hypothetical protein